jgi:hypothetical protein
MTACFVVFMARVMPNGLMARQKGVFDLFFLQVTLGRCSASVCSPPHNKRIFFWCYVMELNGSP